jgi:outer membrane lipoprotein SlyB
MSKLVIGAVVASMIGLSGCNSNDPTQRTVGGATAGAVAGGLIAAATGSGRRGIATGALIGGAAGAFVGYATKPGYCRYRAADGSIYEARCR